MRQQFVETNRRDKAFEIAPWASEVVEVEDGFMAFESINDYETFLNQK